MLRFLLNSKDVLYQVSSELGKAVSFYNSFSDVGQKVPPVTFQTLKKCCFGIKLN